MKNNNKILIVGNYGIGALEHFYVAGLRKLDCDILTFDIQSPVAAFKNENLLNKWRFRLNPFFFFKTVNNELLRYVREHQPTCVIIFKGMEIYPETVLEIKRYTKLLCNYNPDHPFDFYSKGAGNSNVERSINYYDVYITYAEKIAEKLKAKYLTEPFVIPFGYNSSISPRAGNSHNYSFIGAYDKTRLGQLKKLKDLDISVYGSSKWIKTLKINNNDKLKILNYALYNEDYAKVCAASAGVINFLRKQNLVEQSHNMRTFEVPGFGGLLISERTDEQMAFFEEDKEAIYFDTIPELKDKINYLSINPRLTSEIKKSALARAIKSNYSYDERAKSLKRLIERHV